MPLIEKLEALEGVTKVTLLPLSESPLEPDLKARAEEHVGKDGFYVEIEKSTGHQKRYFYFRAYIFTNEVWEDDLVKTIQNSFSAEIVAERKHFGLNPPLLFPTVKDNLLQEIQENGLLELQHRASEVQQTVAEIKQSLKTLTGLEEYEILLLQGGASLQFIMAPMNVAAFLRKKNVKGQYIVNGYWSEKAFTEASKICTAVTSEDADIDFVHYTTNETVEGTQIKPFSSKKGVIQICDASSDFLLTDLPKADIIYSHSQKILGLAGVTIVLVKKSLLVHSDMLPAYLSYNEHAKAESLLNTPSVVSLYSVKFTLRELVNRGKNALVLETKEKAKALRNYLESSRCYTSVGNSETVVRFTCEKESELNSFLESRGFFGLEGHRSVKGFRVFLSPTLNQTDILALITTLKEFEDHHVPVRTV